MTTSGLCTTAGRAVPLISVAVTGEVVAGRARIVLKQRYRNDESRNVEAIYVFPIPADASLTAFSMTCQGRRLEAVVKEREEAFREYDEAVTRGHGAALLEQERANVYTASVGNLLPGEDVDIEVEYVQRLHAQEGRLRVMIPTLVAPRYIPGAPDDTKRTADGWSDPTDQVPDADRITPPVGDAPYRLTLDLAFRMEGKLAIESPSHAITTAREEGAVRVRVLPDEAAVLDRDIVLIAHQAADGPLAGAVGMAGVDCHRVPGERGTVAITVVPDFFDPRRKAAPLKVTFVVDTSGSMGGDSIEQARAAMQCCLRHLREGDAFNIVAFGSQSRSFVPKPVPFTETTLKSADAFIRDLQAGGGTEMLAPLTSAMEETRDGLVVLLTDGQVGNEREILEGVLAARGDSSTRVLAFGIGTNVSDALLRDLARRTDGAVEFIHPGERIDDKVVAQFTRATAARVTDVTLTLDGITLDDLAPARPDALTDGEPWVLFGRYGEPGRGALFIAGKLDGAPFALEVPVALAADAKLPALPKMWATERIRDLSAENVGVRREKALRDRIVKLAVEMGIACEYTAFVVVETRDGRRLATGQPITRVVPVSAPAGWAMFSVASRADLDVPCFLRSQTTDSGMSTQAAYGATGVHEAGVRASHEARARFDASTPSMSDAADTTGSFPRPMRGRPPRHVTTHEDRRDVSPPPPRDLIGEILHAQLASGLWPDGPGYGREPMRLLLATVAALRALMEEGVTTSHPLHGPQVAKAVDALLPLCEQQVDASHDLVARALALAWLVSGPRKRTEITLRFAVLRGFDDLASRLGDERAVREWITATAP